MRTVTHGHSTVATIASIRSVCCLSGSLTVMLSGSYAVLFLGTLSRHGSSSSGCRPDTLMDTDVYERGMSLKRERNGQDSELGFSYDDMEIWSDLE